MGIVPVLLLLLPAVPSLLLPPHSKPIVGGGGDEIAYYIVAKPDLTEKDALRLVHYYQLDVPDYYYHLKTLVIFCDEEFRNIDPEDADEYYSHILYEYKWNSKVSPPSMTTPANPSWPTQGAACK